MMDKFKNPNNHGKQMLNFVGHCPWVIQVAEIFVFSIQVLLSPKLRFGSLPDSIQGIRKILLPGNKAKS
jgi:hypothetical protein